MNTQIFKQLVGSQHNAVMLMLQACIRRCPNDVWTKPVGNWPFWLVVYHVLCFVDLYASKDNESWEPHPTFHPNGKQELADEFPSRTFSKREMLEYWSYCDTKHRKSLEAETTKSLAGPSGFSWYKTTRAELRLVSMRHVSHHMGQLTGMLRKSRIRIKWVYGVE